MNVEKSHVIKIDRTNGIIYLKDNSELDVYPYGLGLYESDKFKADAAQIGWLEWSKDDVKSRASIDSHDLNTMDGIVYYDVIKLTNGFLIEIDDVEIQIINNHDQIIGHINRKS